MSARLPAVAARSDRESGLAVALKGLVYVAAVYLYVRTLATDRALLWSLAATPLAVIAARVWTQRGAGIGAALCVAASVGLAGWLGSELLLDTGAGPDALETLLLSDALFFGLATLATLFALRSLGARWRECSILEAAFVAGSVATTFATHRHGRLDRPRFFADWALAGGLDPQALLFGAGVLSLLVATLLFLRYGKALKVLLSLALLLALGTVLYVLGGELRVEPAEEQLLTSSGDGGSASSPSFGSRPPPTHDPVALAVFHDDFAPREGYYFRQMAWSRLQGRGLVHADAEGYDDDVISTFPDAAPVESAAGPDPDYHKAVATSMFLLADLEEPPSLTSSGRLSSVENPNPRYFARAYEVSSLAMETELVRLRGRRSVPDDWPEEKRRHYLEIPDDPRYATLAEEIVREVDLRHAADDVERAYRIKRFLEREAVYALDVSAEQADAEDPIAHFLFRSRRGYCVYFAHAAAYLMRSTGIAARVGAGFAIARQGAATSETTVLLRNPGHAWPEIHIEGVGWIPFDIYPERSEEPVEPASPMDLESILAELARGDRSGGLAADPQAAPLTIPWALLARLLLWAAALCLALAYALKLARQLGARVGGGAGAERWVVLATLDWLSDMGWPRRHGEIREAYARRLTGIAPSLEALTRVHLRAALGGRPGAAVEELRALRQRVRAELAAGVSSGRRIAGWLNPLGWWFTR